jgi:hypothetical protein
MKEGEMYKGSLKFRFRPTYSGLSVTSMRLNNSTMGLTNATPISGWSNVPYLIGQYISCPAFGSYVFLVTSSGAFNWYGTFVDSKNITIPTPFTGSTTIETFSVGTFNLEYSS